MEFDRKYIIHKQKWRDIQYTKKNFTKNSPNFKNKRVDFVIESRKDE
jgi:hypothetical protein